MKKILFDTDLGDDCDDVLALDLLLAANRFGECELTGITYSSICRNSPSCIHAITSYYGMGNIPIGRMTIPKTRKTERTIMRLRSRKDLPERMRRHMPRHWTR